MELREALCSLFIFAGCDFAYTDEKYSLVKSCTVSDFADGETVFSPSACDGLPVILSGKAVIVSGECGGTVLRRLGVGDTFGAATLLSKKKSHGTYAVADGKCTAAFLPTKTVKRLIAEEPQCALNYVSFLSDRISFLNRKIAAFTAGSAESKLAFWLSEMCENGGEVTAPVSLTELSSMLNIGRASLYRAFNAFADEGIIEKTGKSIRVVRPDLLCNRLK